MFSTEDQEALERLPDSGRNDYPRHRDLRAGCHEPPDQAENAVMETAAVLAAFDEQMRRSPKAGPADRVEIDERVTRVVSGSGGWSGVVWSDLTETDADAVIAAQIRRFAGSGQGWEWKQYSYDRPADLPGRLQAAGFVPDPAETVLVAEVAGLALEPDPPAGVELVPVTGQGTADALVAVHDEVFGGSHDAIGRAVLQGLGMQPCPVAAVIAVAGETPISAGRVEFPEGSDFAGIWGGGTLPAWRGRGVFRSLVAYRAALAHERGYRYLHVDASSDSRPILQRLGFAEIAETTPYRYLADGQVRLG
jgi:GNAT superfamily N-acetyltransferase